MLMHLSCWKRTNIDVIERAKTPTREDALAARLKSLRSQDTASSPSSSPVQKELVSEKTNSTHISSPNHISPTQTIAPSKSPCEKAQSHQDEPPHDEDQDVDAMFHTDDKILEELLGDVGEDEKLGAASVTNEPSDEQVKALLEELSRSVPKGVGGSDDEAARDSDDSDGEHMQHEVDDVIAKFRDEAEVDAALAKDEDEDEDQDQHHKQDQDSSTDDIAIENNKPTNSDLSLPSLPTNLDDLPSPPSATASPSTTRLTTTTTDLDDITARMAALRTAPPNTPSPSLDLPSVPSSKPSGKVVNRLTSHTDYTDDDVDSWCTVCLDDATLRCLGCDDDPYCARCWREMHVGPSAGFDERSHKAVHFSRAKKTEKRKVALGAS